MDAAANAAAGHPDRVGVQIVIAPGVASIIEGAAKFAAPDNQRRLEQTRGI